MARQEIILGALPNGLGGDPPRVASEKINYMTQELYDKNAALGSAASLNAQKARKAAAGEVLLAHFNGVGLQNDLRNTIYITGTPADLAETGTCIGFADGHALGIPGAASLGFYGVLNSSVQWGEVSGAGGMQQEFTGNYVGVELRTFRRVAVTNTAWSVWSQVSAPIVGTIGNAASVGAIFEKGSNANGYYIKFADGTLICWGSRYYPTSLPPGTALSWDAFNTSNWPSAFIAPPVTHVDYSMTTAQGQSIYVNKFTYANSQLIVHAGLNTGYSPSQSHPGFSIGTLTAAFYWAHFQMIGRWK